MALYLDGELQQALPVLTAATRANPNDARGFAFLAAAHYRLGMQKEFETARDRAITLDPQIMQTVP